MPSSAANWPIRPACLDDLPVIVEHNQRLAWETESKKLDQVVLTDGVRRLLGDASKGRYFVAVAEEQLIGQIMLTYEWSDWRNGTIWWIQSVYVRQEFRRRGVYRALHSHVLDQARRVQDVVALRLYVEDANQAGQATYLSLGMKPAGYRVFEQPVQTT